MNSPVKIKSALVSVFSKEGLQPLIEALHKQNVTLYATGGTFDFIEKLNIPVTAVEDVTDYPSILGGRVKTLHPKVFGGILGRRENSEDLLQLEKYEIPQLDLVIVDLYPFEKTVASGADEKDIIEKIDIGGISLIRAAAKNFNDVMIIPSCDDYSFLLDLLNKQKGSSAIEDRKRMATRAFAVSSHYDTAIYNYFNKENTFDYFKASELQSKTLRYGENPHQQGKFFGSLNDVFEQIHGKELSYNNILDCDAAVNLIGEFSSSLSGGEGRGEVTCAIIKHTNACGIASRSSLIEAWNAALAGDPVSAFGGIIICNANIDFATAESINKLFFEILIAPSFDDKALSFLTEKKNRIILKLKNLPANTTQLRSALNGMLVQDKDKVEISAASFQFVTDKKPTDVETDDMVFANKLVRNTKSNAIILAKNKQMLGSGAGQTSRVDALNHAIAKAKHFGFDMKGAVMASDAFFPFPDCVEIAHKAGITAIIQPGGSIKDKESIEYCNKNSLSMVLTGKRHFKH